MFGWDGRRTDGERMRNLIIAIILSLFAAFWWGRDFKASNKQRIDIWGVAIKAFKEHPVVGVGPGEFETYFRNNKPEGFGVNVAANAHNDILQVAATTGVVGLFFYLAFFYAAFRSVSGPSLGALTALFVAAKFNPIPIEAIVLAAVILGMRHKGTGRVLLIPPVAATSIALVAVAFIASADNMAARSNFLYLRKACQINPFELSYKARMMNLGMDEMKKTDSMDIRNAIYDEFKKEASVAIKLRPSAPVTHKLVEFVNKIGSKK